MRLHPLLRAHLEPVARRRRHFQLWCKLAGAWAVAATAALTILGLQRAIGWSSTLSLPFSALVGLALAAIVQACTKLATSVRLALAVKV